MCNIEEKSEFMELEDLYLYNTSSTMNELATFWQIFYILFFQN